MDLQDEGGRGYVKHRRACRIGVTGVGGGVGQSIVRSLQMWSVKPWLMGFDMNPDSSGLFFCDVGHVIPPASHDDYVDALLGRCEAEGVELLIPGSDPELLPLATARDRFEEIGVEVLVASSDVIRIARDKLKCWEFFETCDVPYARTIRLSPEGDGPAALRYPLIVKPIDGSASRNVTVVLDADELRPLDTGADLIVQEYLIPAEWGLSRPELTLRDAYRDGALRQEDELSLQFCIGTNGEELGAFASRNRLMNGIPMVIEPAPMSEHLDVARRAVRALAELGLTGPCNLQGRNTSEGIVFFEVNARFTGITAMRTAMGFREVEAAVRHWLLGESAEQLAPILRQPESLACLRYVTEHIMDVEELAAFRRQRNRDVGP